MTSKHQISPPEQALFGNFSLTFFQCSISAIGEITFTHIDESVQQLFGVPVTDVITNANTLLNIIDTEYRSQFIAAFKQTGKMEWLGNITLPLGQQKRVKAEGNINK